MNGPAISVLINTLNEEQNLPFALRSVAAWATEVIVVDMHSTDATRDIAERFGARVFLHEPMGFSEPARAFGIEQARCPWILILDADELVPIGLYRALREVVLEGNADVVRIPRQNYMFGAKIEHSGWHPYEDRQARFFRKGALTTTHEIHRFLKPAPQARLLSLPYVEGSSLVHFNYVTINQFVEKLNRYTSIEATQGIDGGRFVSDVGALSLAIREWFTRYVSKQGFRDGWRGFYLASMMAFYRLVTVAKMREQREVGAAEHISRGYVEIAEGILSEYAVVADASPRSDQTTASE